MFVTALLFVGLGLTYLGRWPAPAKWGPATFYHNSAIRAWKVDASGRVTFGQNELA